MIAYSGTTGKISGQIINKESGEPLIGVNIIVEGNTYGSASDLNGYYSILNLPPGTYTITAMSIGYSTVKVTDIKVSIDLTAKVDIEMESSALQMGDVIVVGHKPLVKKDMTASTAVVNAEDIESLPIDNISDLLNMQAGLTRDASGGMHVRGGRSGEIMYAIDGVPMTDSYDGSTVIEVNKNMVNELQFVSGAFNAEYGRAMSGYVNIVTKEGDNKVRMGVDTYLGDYFTSNTNIFRGGDRFDITAINNLEAYLNLPVLQDRLWFFGNARRTSSDGWINGKYVFNPWDITRNNGASLPPEIRYTIQSTGDSSLMPMNWSDKMYYHGKLTWKATNKITLNYNAIYDTENWQTYDHSFAYNPKGRIKRFRRSFTNSVTLSHMLTNNTFYNLIFSNFNKNYKHYVYENKNDSRYTHDLLFSQAPSETPSFLTGGTSRDHFFRETNNNLVKLDITSQVNRTNQIKAGVEANFHRLEYEYINLLQEAGITSPSESGNPFVNVYIPDINDPNENTAIDIYKRVPREYSAYIQDKIELHDLIINAGLRFDYFDAAAYTLKDINDPDIYRPKDPLHLIESFEERQSHWYKDSKPKYSFSPRLGIAFPVTAGGVVHFSYGYFFQAPNFEYLYQNPEFKFGGSTGNIGLAGNADMNPERTVNGEIGFKQSFMDMAAVEITAYFRDIRDLVGSRADEITIYGGTSWYNQLENSDFGLVRGIILAIDKPFSNGWSASIDYTYQIAEGNASDPNAIRNQYLGGERPEIQMVRLDFDQTHTVNFNFSYASQQNYGFSVIGRFGSGYPYTPDQSINISTILTNKETKPESFNMDLNVFKRFEFRNISMKLYSRLYNVFDILNENIVYGNSGTADFSLDEYLNYQREAPEIINTIDEYYRNPTFYSEPRRIEVGLSVDWNK